MWQWPIWRLSADNLSWHEWKVQQAVVDNDEAFETWGHEQFSQHSCRRKWGEQQLADAQLRHHCRRLVPPTRIGPIK